MTVNITHNNSRPPTNTPRMKEVSKPSSHETLSEAAFFPKDFITVEQYVDPQITHWKYEAKMASPIIMLQKVIVFNMIIVMVKHAPVDVLQTTHMEIRVVLNASIEARRIRPLPARALPVISSAVILDPSEHTMSVLLRVGVGVGVGLGVGVAVTLIVEFVEFVELLLIGDFVVLAAGDFELSVLHTLVVFVLVQVK
jgi:hypothetical protein